MARPTGVTIIAVLAAIGGVFGVLGGLGLVGLGGLVAATGAGGLAVIFGLLVLALGVVDLALAYGFWTAKPWAWTWGITIQVVGVIIAILEVPLIGASITSAIISIVIAAILIYYLSQPAIRKYFGAPETGWPFMGTR
jgi:hypothetical protein